MGELELYRAAPREPADDIHFSYIINSSDRYE